MGKQHNRRVYAGYYKKYDGSLIYVIAVLKDADTGKDVVVFHHGYETKQPFVMTKESFCEMVEVDGEYVDKYARQTQMKITEGHIDSFGSSNSPDRCATRSRTITSKHIRCENFAQQPTM